MKLDVNSGKPKLVFLDFSKSKSLLDFFYNFLKEDAVANREEIIDMKKDDAMDLFIFSVVEHSNSAITLPLHTGPTVYYAVK